MTHETTMTCGRCGGSWASPETTEAVRANIAELVRGHHMIEAIRLLREHTGIGLTDAKAVANHITGKPRVCHRCRAALASSGQVVCPGCGSVNYDW